MYVIGGHMGVAGMEGEGGVPQVHFEQQPGLPQKIAGETLSLLGLMAKIKCSICSYQFNIWYAGHSPALILI